MLAGLAPASLYVAAGLGLALYDPFWAFPMAPWTAAMDPAGEIGRGVGPVEPLIAAVVASGGGGDLVYALAAGRLRRQA